MSSGGSGGASSGSPMGAAASGLSGLQSAGNNSGGGGYYYGGYASGYPGSWYTSAYLKGMADVVRSAGYASLMSGEAAQSYEQAFSTDLDNRLKATNNYFAVKRMNLSLQSRGRGTPSTPAELVHQAHEMAPERLKHQPARSVHGRSRLADGAQG